MKTYQKTIMAQRCISTLFFTMLVFILAGFSQQTVSVNSLDINLYPRVNVTHPNLPSPFVTDDNREFVIAHTKENKFAVMEVTLNDSGMCQQLVVDSTDFPTLAKTGLHSEDELAGTKMVTGRSLAEITDVGRPGEYSEDGFMSANEDILSVLKTDNGIVRRLGLTHPQTAKPLFHILNMMDTDIKLKRWNMAQHEWQNIPALFYNDKKILLEAHDTKGGQLSIFDDGIQGAFWMVFRRDMEPEEHQFLKRKYSFLTPAQMDTLIKKLTTIYTGEMVPQYIMRYGFYEGHSSWRADPITIAFMFGLKSLADIEQAFPGPLYNILTAEFTRDFSLGGES